MDIIPIPSKHKAAEHLVKHAKSLVSQADYYPKDGDKLMDVMYENEQLKAENSKLRETLNKAYDFMK